MTRNPRETMWQADKALSYRSCRSDSEWRKYRDAAVDAGLIEFDPVDACYYPTDLYIELMEEME